MGFLGFLIFVVIAGAGFWLLLFLLGFIPYWLGGGIKETIKDKFFSKK